MFKTIAEFEKSFPAIKDMTAEQKQKCLEVFNAMKRENPKMDDGMAIATAIKTAKGEMKKDKMDEAEGIFHYLSIVGQTGEKVTTLEVLRVGIIRDRDLKITQKMLEEYVQNFKDNVYGTEIQVNLEHNRGSEAAGWVKDLSIEGDKLMAKVEWTELGMEKISKKLFKFVSAELAYKYPHHQTGKLVGNVFIGLALTNTPALKGQEALALSEQIEALINKNNLMFKKLLQTLKERKFVSKEEKATMHTLLADLPDEEKKEAEGDVGEVDKKPEAPEKTEEEKKAEKDAADAAAKAKDGKEGGEQLAEKLIEVNKKNTELSEKIAKIELKEKAQKDYLLTTNRKVGLQEADLSTVVDFIATLSEEQRTAFDQVFSKIRAVDLSIKGANKTAEQLSEEAKLTEADKEAQEMAVKTGKPLADCLTEVYKSKGIV